jgi:hypothetical protein
LSWKSSKAAPTAAARRSVLTPGPSAGAPGRAAQAGSARHRLCPQFFDALLRGCDFLLDLGLRLCHDLPFSRGRPKGGEPIRHPNANSPALRAERWRADGGDAPSLRLHIPAVLHHERTYEIACLMRVQAHADARAPWHALRVLADGELQWSRRIGTDHPAPFDGLEYRFRRTVPAGRALDVQAYADCGQARRLALTIEAETADDGA